MKDRQQQPQVFISYASEDRDTAIKIAKALEKRHVEVWYDMAVPVGDSLFEHVYNVISASDYLVVLISAQTLKSKWVSYELKTALGKELSTRDITILPVLISDAEIPDYLQKFQIFDCRGDFEKGLNLLASQISSAPEIDFSQLNWEKFVQLIVDLLSRLNFRNIETQVRLVGREFDIKAEFVGLDPFDVTTKEEWLVECKFYSKSRVNLASLQHLFSKLEEVPNAKGLIVMNSQLTSVGLEYLERLKKNSKSTVRVIDGTELKRLLIMHKDLIGKYFSETK